MIKNVSIAGQVTKNEQQPGAEEVTLPKGQVDTYRIFNSNRKIMEKVVFVLMSP